ncbi:hypothetical protein H5410_056738 [Solanum commersonii]|uniref:Uncharacterized protein n=1 Tax=Solanum commersonii TaxID=4109 RepID=A0A9J5WN52_SOLCO|nr:hypothetical protein H5410_056738 [Solanum commersonii]
MIFTLAILASNASSCSSKVYECPYTKDDSILTHNGLPVFSNRHLFQLTQDQKGLYKACNGADCKGLSTLEQKVISKLISDSPTGLSDPQAFISLFFSASLFLLANKTQVQQFKKDVSNSATQDSIMNVHNKTQFTHARINCVPRDSSCDTPLPKILTLAILASNASSGMTKFRNQMQRSLSQRRTQCMLSLIGLLVFSNQHLFQLTQNQKDLYKACNGAECKGMVFIVFENLYCNGSLGAVSRDRRYTRRWALWYCFAKLLGDTLTAPFHHQLDLSLQGSAHLYKRRSLGRSATRQLGSAILKPSFLRSFQPLCSFLPSSVHALPQTLNTLNLRVFIIY